MEKRAAIIIVNWNGCADTLECLASLMRIDYPAYHIYVVDNGSADGSLEKLSDAYGNNSRVTILDGKENLGFAGGNNFALREALKERGAPFEYFLLLNNDTIVDPPFLSLLVDAMEKNPRLGIAGSKTYFAGTKRFWFIGGTVNWLKNKGSHLHYDEEDRGQFDALAAIPADFVSGCVLLIRRSVVEKIGLMDESYFLYYEDGDWNLAARRAGWDSAVVPRSVVWHKVSRSTKAGSPSYIYYHVRNGAIMAQKFGTPLSLAALHVYNAYVAAKQIVKLLIPSKRKWAKAVLAGLSDFYKGKRGPLQKTTL
jgi:hypothetical protein